MPRAKEQPLVTDEEQLRNDHEPVLQEQIPAPTHAISRLAERTQDDNLQDQYSQLTGLDFTGTETLTRQEFKDEADLNILLSRYGVAQMRPVQYGKEVDYTVDLQTAISALEAANAATFDVPEELRDKYPTWRHVLNGAESGEYHQDLLNLAEKKKADATAKEAAEREQQRAEQIPKSDTGGVKPA